MLMIKPDADADAGGEDVDNLIKGRQKIVTNIHNPKPLILK